MAPTPTNLRALSAEKALQVTWPSGKIDILPFKFLRENCPCATCIHEFTGVRLIDPASIPEDIRPVAINFVGNYAIKIAWSDGHDTGLFSWETLDRLSHQSAKPS